MVDEQTFVDEVRAMERTLYRVSRGYLGSWQECADAVQEALGKAWAKRESLSPERFRPWLTCIVINECHNIGRRKKRVVLAAEVEPEGAYMPKTEADLYDSLRELPDKLRLPLTLHYLEGYELEDAARTLRLPRGTVKSRLHHARKALRLQLEKEDQE